MTNAVEVCSTQFNFLRIRTPPAPSDGTVCFCTAWSSSKRHRSFYCLLLSCLLSTLFLAWYYLFRLKLQRLIQCVLLMERMLVLPIMCIYLASNMFEVSFPLNNMVVWNGHAYIWAALKHSFTCTFFFYCEAVLL